MRLFHSKLKASVRNTAFRHRRIQQKSKSFPRRLFRGRKRRHDFPGWAVTVAAALTDGRTALCGRADRTQLGHLPFPSPVRPFSRVHWLKRLSGGGKIPEVELWRREAHVVLTATRKTRGPRCPHSNTQNGRRIVPLSNVEFEAGVEGRSFSERKVPRIDQDRQRGRRVRVRAGATGGGVPPVIKLNPPNESPPASLRSPFRRLI